MFAALFFKKQKMKANNNEVKGAELAAIVLAVMGLSMMLANVIHSLFLKL